MASSARVRTRSRADGHRTAAAVRSGAARIDPGDAVWLAAVPAALVAVLIVVVLGPPLGGLLFPPSSLSFWASVQGIVIPEPTEQARFLLVLSGPLLLTGLTILLVRRPPRMDADVAGNVAAAIQVGALLFVAGCFVAQRAYTFSFIYSSSGTAEHTVYFTIPTLLLAIAIGVGSVRAAHAPRIRETFAAWTAETPARAAGATLIALAFVTITLLPALNTDSSIVNANEAVSYHLQFTYDETFAVLDGRSPIGDYAAQYGSLVPYLMAAGMSLLGDTLIVFTALMATLTGIALLAAFGMLRRLTRSSVAALLLFLPLAATCAFMMRGPSDDRYSLVNYFGTFPLRCAGPLLVAWLTARHLDGAWPRRAWPLFVLGGLAAMNNTDFGIAAVGATLAALLWTGGRPTRASLMRLAGQAAIGLAAAVALVTVLLLARTGEAPHFALLFRFARMFAVGGFSMLPMQPVIGFSTVIYLTYIAAIGLATVRALRSEPDRLLTGLLAWSGIFGFGAAAYYMGRSHPEVLTNMFPAWALCVTLLAVAAVRQLADGTPLRPLPAVAAMTGFGLLVCSLAQTPSPWSQLERVRAGSQAEAFERSKLQRYIAARTEPGEPIVLLTQLGHLRAKRAGAEDVTPYTGAESIQTEQQLDETVAMLRAEGGSKVFVPTEAVQPELPLALERHGFRLAQHGPEGVDLLIDRGEPR